MQTVIGVAAASTTRDRWDQNMCLRFPGMDSQAPGPSSADSVRT